MEIPAIKAGILQISVRILRIPLGILQFNQIILRREKTAVIFSDCCFFVK